MKSLLYEISAWWNYKLLLQKKRKNNNEGRETKKEKFAADATERLQPDASAR